MPLSQVEKIVCQMIRNCDKKYTRAENLSALYIIPQPSSVQPHFNLTSNIYD